MGGSDYAAEPGGTIVDGHNAYESFDMTAGGIDTVLELTSPSGYVTYYSPVPLRIDNVVFTRVGSGVYRGIINYIISGSNDNSTWTELASGNFTDTANSATLSIAIDSSKYDTNYSYKYYKFYGVNDGGSAILVFPKIYLYGQEFVRTKQESKGYIRAINAEEYEEEIAQYGICGAFVISGNDVRLPLWKGYQTPLGNSVPVKGNGTTLGMSDGTVNAGFVVVNSDEVRLATTAYGTNIGTVATQSYPARPVFTGFGITTDPTKSGIIADTSGYAKDGFYWCIQIFNAATELSTQESAQLASQMQTKAQTDLANVANNLDFIIKHEESADGSLGYNLYRSGMVEQWGVTSIATSQGTSTVILPVEMANTDYIPLVTIYGENGLYNGNTNGSYFTAANLTTTGFDIFVSTTSYLRRKFWRVIGKAAVQ